MPHGLPEPEFYGDLVYTFKKIVGRTDCSDQFRKIIIRIGYNLNVMRQSACLVLSPITVYNYDSFLNRTPVGRASDSIMAPTSSYLFLLVGAGAVSSIAWLTGALPVILFCFRFSVV